LLASAGVLLGYAFIFVVVRENSYAASTIRVEDKQPGPYALVRRPMYSGALLMFGLTPFALGRSAISPATCRTTTPSAESRSTGCCRACGDRR
jgi:protein-S-isoprenylcysteine O-methyltransferase Ste14